jgi:3-hydroxyisobutyrate dehydrogenase
MNKNTSIGWVGLGVMGEPMCRHLLDAGYQLAVFSRTREKSDRLVDAGAHWCDSPSLLAEQCDVVFTMVGTGDEVRDVYFSETGLFSVAIEGKIFIDMGTTAPALTAEIADYVREHGAACIDAPVSGGDIGARSASLSIMAGGQAGFIDEVKPLFDCLGNVQHMGEEGSGQHTKMCNQITIAGTMIGVCEALLYGHKAGLDLTTMLSSISGGAAGCWTLNNLAPRIVNRNFDPGFYVEHFIKDMGIALKESEAMGLSLPGLALVKQMYLAVQAQGHGKLGTHALTLALEKMNGI